MKLYRFLSLALLALTWTGAGGCDGALGDEPGVPSPEAPALRQSALTSAQKTTLFAAARAKIGVNVGLQCKPWVTKIFKDALNIAIPSTAATQYAWNASNAVTATAAWRATYAIARMDDHSISANTTRTISINVPNGDPYVVVVYGQVEARLLRPNGAVAVGPVTGSSLGVVSTSFSGQGTYSLRVTNPSGATRTCTVVVLSLSRFASDFMTARRGDVVQMYMQTSAGINPHTAIVQNDFNAGANNWLDANWVGVNIVGEHTVTVTDMIRWCARRPTFGFTVYRID